MKKKNKTTDPFAVEQLINKDFEYIHFKVEVHGLKTDQWGCYNKRSNALLAMVKWSGPWRQYCFFPLADTVFSQSCLEDISNFLRQLNFQHRMKRKRIKRVRQIAKL